MMVKSNKKKRRHMNSSMKHLFFHSLLNQADKKPTKKTLRNKSLIKKQNKNDVKVDIKV